MKNVLVISYSPLHNAPRILRQIKALKNDYKITTIGYSPILDDSIKHYLVRVQERKIFYKKIFVLIRLLTNYNKYILEELNNSLDLDNILNEDIIIPDIIIAHDWNGLYLASNLKTKYNWQAKIYFDAHEYAPKEFDRSIIWRLLIQPVIKYALERCKADISLMSTVCEGIAREYEKYFCFPDGFVKVITNAAEYKENLKPNDIEGKIRLIHHGDASRERKLELMIKMMSYLDPKKYELTFMLVSSDKVYYDHLIGLAKKHANINFIKPVPFDNIIKTLYRYDIGVFLLLPENFNYKYALPNKLFEFIQARLAIAISPSIEMVKIVKQYKLGVFGDDFSPKSLANKIRQITPEEMMEYKNNADKYAQELSAEENIKKIKEIIAELAED